MNKKYEIDTESNLLTNLFLEYDIKEPEYGEDFIASDEQLKMKYSTLEYYQKLQEEGKTINVHFTGVKGSVLFAFYGDIELTYSIRNFSTGRIDRRNSLSILQRSYKVKVKKVIPDEKRIILRDSDQAYDNRKAALEVINEKLDKNEDIYLRGQIISLQYSSGKYRPGTAAYVNIEGLGILGIITIRNWSSGYTTEDYFRNTIQQHAGSIISFKVVGRTRVSGARKAFICSRRAYLEASGYDPWNIVEQKLFVKSSVIVKIVDNGKSEGCMFGALDGLPDFNMLCYPDDASGLRLQDMEIGKYYLGYIQKLDVKKKFMRVRLQAPVSAGNEMHEIERIRTEE